MNTFLMSIRPNWSEKIGNGLKLYEVRKTPLRTGDVVYVWVTKNGEGLYFDYLKKELFLFGKCAHNGLILNGTIPLKFTVGEVIEVKYIYDRFNIKDGLHFYDIQPHDLPLKACLSIDEINAYGKGKDLYFHEITNLEIFDKSMQLSDFYRTNLWASNSMLKDLDREQEKDYQVKRPPQSYMRVYLKE